VLSSECPRAREGSHRLSCVLSFSFIVRGVSIGKPACLLQYQGVVDVVMPRPEKPIEKLLFVRKSFQGIQRCSLNKVFMLTLPTLDTIGVRTEETAASRPGIKNSE